MDAAGGVATTSGSTGSLRTKISLSRGTPVLVIPFHLMKPQLPACSSMPGSSNLLVANGLESALNRHCGAKRLKEPLSAFLPHLPGNIDSAVQQESSSLRALIDKPPIPKELCPLSSTNLAGFKLLPGPIPESYSVFVAGCVATVDDKHKKKNKRSLEVVDEKEEIDVEKKLKKRKDEDREKKRKRKKDKKKEKKKSSPNYAAAV